MSQKQILLVTNAGPLRAAADGSYLVIDNSLNYSWRLFPPMVRLLVKGTGTCSIDSRDVDGNITTAVDEFSVSNSTGEMFYTFPGDSAVYIRAVLTGSCSVEMI